VGQESRTVETRVVCSSFAAGSRSGQPFRKKPHLGLRGVASSLFRCASIFVALRSSKLRCDCPAEPERNLRLAIAVAPEARNGDNTCNRRLRAFAHATKARPPHPTMRSSSRCIDTGSKQCEHKLLPSARTHIQAYQGSDRQALGTTLFSFVGIL
jgi:hypothetical protein